MNTHSTRLSVDDVLAALSNVQRRKLLDSLLADSPPDGETSVAVDDDVAMHHVHLPKLVDDGLVDWDEETNTVTRGPNFEDAAEILELLDENAGVLPPGEAAL